VSRPADLIPEFWKRFGSKIPVDQVVTYCEHWVACVGVFDHHKKPVPGLGPLPGKAAFFFVDQCPEANWAHECCYILMTPEGGIAKADYIWPPDPNIELVPLDR
jgi:hypothetical protein